ncbi:elongation factor G [Aminivibrio sp.]|jgi:elongation factor G|uniref:elongation factor G n=1 Tax=Aminivibrio sp. TaxID=1872489 RepID=UPI001A60EAF7|nr:elongation factor G [Aminivibrio sp.]MBL3540352.1 elongation factor G [Aminivibrio sp.]MDK2958921.1 elongation factor [Synergistaceae bacterium]
MGTRQPENTRSIAIAAHGGAGKTSLVEAMLFDNGITSRLGKVEDGNTVSDFSQEEQKRQISINTSLITMERKGRQLFVLDTPGFADFVGEMRSAIRVADSLLIAVSGVSGIEVQTDKVWEMGSEFNLPTAFYISKLDRENADFAKVLTDIRSDYSDKAVAVFLPIGAEASFKGVVDLLGNKAYMYEADGSGKFTEGDIPAEMADEAAQARESLVEAIVEADDELMMRYLDGESISVDELLPALRKAIASRIVMPVFPGSSAMNVGVHQILDFIADFFPSPLDSRSRPALKGQESIEIAPDPEGQFSAICFKIMVDPYVGKLSFIRVNSGSLTTDNTIFNVNKGEEERISAFKFMTGKEGKDVKEITVGDILAIPKLHSTQVGDSLSVKGSTITFPPIDFPKPVYSVAIVAKSRADEDKLGNAIHKILEEDPTLTFEKNAETNDSVLSGMGDMHIDIVLSRIKERYGVELDTKTPQVPYRETIRKTAEAQGKHKKQTGGHGQYGDVHIRYTPLERGEGFVFEDKIVGGAIPKGFIPAVEKGLREALVKGPLAGFPVVDFKATLYFGSYHDVDSSEMAFKLAARLSFKKGILEANPVLLEPIMNVEVTVPEEYLGDVMGDFNGRRGRILGIDSKGHQQVVKAQCPLAEMFRYAIILRSMTSGRGTFTMEYDHYEEVPAEIAKKVIAAHKQEDEEE